MKNISRPLKLFLTICYLSSAYAQEYYIIVHGTWAQHESWAQPGGDFFEELQQTVGPEVRVVPFSWSGKNNHTERCRAAERLATFLKKFPDSISVTLIAHSHGANVCFLASQMLTSNRPIKCLYALGAPIDLLHYQPNMAVIHNLYNIFSFGDPVQTVSGYFERALPPHAHIFNILLTIDETRPNHAELHCPLVAHWLPTVPFLCAQTVGSRDPWYGSLILHAQKPPFYCINNELPELLENEKKLYAVLSTYLLPKNHKKERQEFKSSYLS